MSRDTREGIIDRFAFHKGTEITGPKHGEVRAKFRDLALWVLDDVPDSRERSLVLTNLQQAMMWANAAIAIHSEDEPLQDRRDEA